MLDEPNQILARLGVNEQVKRNWAKPNGSQIRQECAVNYASPESKTIAFSISSLLIICHYFDL